MAKITNRHQHHALLLPPIRKTGSETDYAAYIQKYFANQDEKAWIVVPGPVSVLGQITKSILPLCPGVQAGERHKDNPSHTLFTRYCPTGLYSLYISEVRASWLFCCPRTVCIIFQQWYEHCEKVRIDWR